jgi:hypothetical protein
MCFPDLYAQTTGNLRAKPPFYASLPVSQLRGGQFLPVQISRTSANLTAYAVRMPDRKIRVVVDDLDQNPIGIVHVAAVPHKGASECLLSRER